jgi:phospholipid/cholesterol/gamma-HCH transport system substrate-binding protein
LTRRTDEGEELLSRAVRASRALEHFARRLDRGQGALPRLVEDEVYARRVLGNLDRAIADLADVAAKLDHGQGTLGKLVNDPSLYRRAEGVLESMRRSWLLRLFGAGGKSAAGDLSPPATTPVPDTALPGAAETRTPE